MVSVWRVDIKDTLPADTIDVFCSSESFLQVTGKINPEILDACVVTWNSFSVHMFVFTY
jgi:hypothetical protein